MNGSGGNKSLPIFGLILPVVKAKVPTNKIAMLARLCHTEIVPIGHNDNEQVENLIMWVRSFIYLLNNIKRCKQT